MKRLIFSALACMVILATQAQPSVETERQYLSGHGADDMVQWDFRCTDGRNSGQWTKIGVPSCWELQGFGTYQYGMRFYGKATPEALLMRKDIIVLPSNCLKHGGADRFCLPLKLSLPMRE